jgi:cysteinyl-tRNA synthetase
MLRIFNTASGKKETFQPIHPDCVTMYTCGMTVYSFTHIGHLKSYLTSDIACRYLRFLGYNVRQVMNVTDVGHHVKDADTGEDKLERKAIKTNTSPWDIARHYEKIFFDAIDEMNISKPNIIARASEHINDMIELVKTLEERGYTYKTSVGLTFDTSKFADYSKFANLDLKNQEAGYRVQVDDERRAPWDFALWITNKPNHIMRWDSQWGMGYPGWHIECSAMSKKYLGEQVDIHTGGVDHIKIHHTNEIAQSEGASGKKFVNYWIHTDFLQINKEKMSKSLGNLYTLENLKENGYSPLTLRYLFMKGDYKKPFDFTWESLYNAQNELVKLWRFFAANNGLIHGNVLEEYKAKFQENMDDTFNTAKSLAVLWEVVNSKTIKNEDKVATAYELDKVFGLDLENSQYNLQVLEEMQNINYWERQTAQLKLSDREEARISRNFAAADAIRDEIDELGYSIVDTPTGSYLQIKSYGKLGEAMHITPYGESE